MSNTPEEILYQIFEIDVNMNVDLAQKYIRDRGFEITEPSFGLPLEAIPKQLLRHYADKRGGYYKVIGKQIKGRKYVFASYPLDDDFLPYEYLFQWGKNILRAEQRQTLAKLFNKEIN